MTRWLLSLIPVVSASLAAGFILGAVFGESRALKESPQHTSITVVGDPTRALTSVASKRRLDRAWRERDG